MEAGELETGTLMTHPRHCTDAINHKDMTRTEQVSLVNKHEQEPQE